MASTYTDNLKIELITTGEQAGSWGATTNTNFGSASGGVTSGFEEAIVGRGNPQFTADSNLTLTLSDTPSTQIARCIFLYVDSTLSLTATRDLIVPTIKKTYIVQNATTGSQSVRVKTAAGTGITIPNGKKMLLYVDDTNVVEQVDYIGALVLGAALPVASGGTGVTSSTGSGSNVLSTSPTLVTPILGTPTSGTLTNCTGLPIVAGTTGTLSVARGGTGVTTSTGSGATVLSTSPTLVTPALGTPSSGNLSNCSSLPIDGGTTGTLPTNRGGTGVTAASTGTGGVVLSASPQLTGVVTVGGTSIVGLEVGDTTSGVATATAYIDFHTGANIDYDARIVATGGTGSLGDADIDVECATFDITGALSKGSGSFKISHPLPEKTDTHYLVHSFIEGPKADLIYSGMVRLVSGYAHINIDAVSGMTAGTFEVLCRDVRRSTTNESGFAKIRSEFYGSSLHIYAEDQNCVDEIFWQVIGERKDPHMYETSWTDEEGHVMVEPKRAIK